MAKMATVLSLAASSSTAAFSLEGVFRVDVKIEVDDLATAAGTFYLRTRSNGKAEWDNHPYHFAPKTAGNGLMARFDWFDVCGAEASIYFARSSGGTAETAKVFINAI